MKGPWIDFLDAIESSGPNVGSAIEVAPSLPLTCSVIICTRNRPQELARCLEAVAKVNPAPSEVVVVDNASSDASALELAQIWKARYLSAPRPGLSHARNSGARSCNSEIVAFLDDDAVPEPDWLFHLASEFGDSRVAAVAGKICAPAEPDGIDDQCAVFSRTNDTRERRVIDRDTEAWFEMANFGGVGDGGNMAFRRNVFEIWDGFDERLGRGAPLIGGEEHYAFFSLIDRGYRAVYTPLAIVNHRCLGTLDELQARQFSDFAAAASYMALIVAEHPNYRWRTIRYMVTGLLGARRSWRKTSPESPSCVLPLQQRIRAYLSGPPLYARTKLSTQRACLSDNHTALAKRNASDPCGQRLATEPNVAYSGPG